MKIFLATVDQKEKDIKSLIKEGFYISFSEDILKDGDKYDKLISAVPQNKLLINNKKDFLTDERKASDIFQKIAKKVSSSRKNASEEDILRIASYNAARIFNMQDDLPDKYVYKIRNSLYLNITNRCSNNCDFCPRLTEPVVKGHYLKIKKEPTAERVIDDIKALGNPKKFDEVIFCGYGESTTRIDVVKKVAKWLKDNGCKTRINTNGHANLIAQKDILPELKGLFDTISISLNFHSPDLYDNHCRPIFKKTWEGILDFAEKAKQDSPKVVLSVVSGCKDVDVKKCREIANKIGVNFRKRTYYK
jgi:TatD DNase family protein